MHYVDMDPGLDCVYWIFIKQDKYVVKYQSTFWLWKFYLISIVNKRNAEYTSLILLNNFWTVQSVKSATLKLVPSAYNSWETLRLAYERMKLVP